MADARRVVAGGLGRIERDEKGGLWRGSDAFDQFLDLDCVNVVFRGFSEVEALLKGLGWMPVLISHEATVGRKRCMSGGGRGREVPRRLRVEMFLNLQRKMKRMAARYKDDEPVSIGYEPITVIKYVHDAVVVRTWFGTFIIGPTTVAVVKDGKVAAARIEEKGGSLEIVPRPEAEELRDVIRAYLPDSLPPQLRRKGDKIYLDEAEVEVATIYEL